MSRRPLIKIMLVGLALSALLGCAPGQVVIIEPGHPEYARIPSGHLPPPGMCRIWYPDRPPGQQPPPGECWELRRHMPPGAWLVRG